VEQTTLAITSELGTEQAVALRPEQRRRLVELMAMALLAVRRASDRAASEEHADDAASE